MPVASVFGSEYQAGAYVEVLGTQGTNPLSQWKVPAKNLQKLYDKGVKGSVYSSTGSALKLQAPKDDKAVLGLVQPFLVLQVSLQGQPLTVELVVQDTAGTRRRLILSSSFTDAKVTPLHCQVPFAAVARGTWLNLTLPLAELTTLFFRGATYRSLDSLVFNGSCRLRRIFTLREPPYNTLTPNDQFAAPQPLPLPRGLELPPELDAFTQVLDARALYSMGVQLPGAATAQGTSRGPASRAGRPGTDAATGSATGPRPPRLVTPQQASNALGVTSPGTYTPLSPLLIHSSDDEGTLSPLGPAVPGGISQDSLRQREQQQPSSWAMAVRRAPPPASDVRTPARQAPAGDNPLAPWNANATDGGARGTLGRSGAERAETPAKAELLKSLLPPTPVSTFVGSGPGRPTTDSAAVMSSSSRSRAGPMAGRRAISAQVSQRSGEAIASTANPPSPMRAPPHASPSRGGVIAAGRRRGSPNGRPDAPPTPAKAPASGAVTAPQCSLSSSNSFEVHLPGALQQQQQLPPDFGYATLTTPGSPNTRYGRRAGAPAGAATAGVNIPCTIKEGEAMNTTPRGFNVTSTAAQGAQQGAPQAQGPQERLALSRAASQQAGRRSRLPGSPGAGSTRANGAGGRGGGKAATHSTSTVGGRAGSPPRATGSPPLPSAAQGGLSGTSAFNSPGMSALPARASMTLNATGAGGRTVSPARPERGQLRSPPRRDPGQLARRSGDMDHMGHMDLEGLLQVKGGVDASGDYGLLLPRLSSGVAGGAIAPPFPGAFGRLSRSSLTGDMPCPAVLSSPTSISPPSSSTNLQSYNTGGVGKPGTGQQGGDGQGPTLPALSAAPVSLMQSVSMSRDRYARMSSSSASSFADAATAATGQQGAGTGPGPASRGVPPASSRRSPPRTNSPGPHHHHPGRVPSPVPGASHLPSRRPSPGRNTNTLKPASPPSRLPTSATQPTTSPLPHTAMQEPNMTSGEQRDPKQQVASAKTVAQVARQQPVVARRLSPSRGAPGAAPALLPAARAASPGTIAAVRPSPGVASPSRTTNPVKQLPVSNAGSSPAAVGASTTPPGRIASPGRGANAGTTAPSNARAPPAGGRPSRAPIPAPGPQVPGGAGVAGRGARVGAMVAAAARGVQGASVASSVCEVDESINLVSGWGGFGVDEDDVLASHLQTAPRPVHAAQHHSALPGIKRNLSNTNHSTNPPHQQMDSRTAGAGVATAGPTVPAGSGLQVDGLGAPIWSNEAPSTRTKPYMDYMDSMDSVLQGDVTIPSQGGAAAVMTQGTVGAAGGAPVHMHGTFSFPQADSGMMETAALRHGGYGEQSSRGYHAGVAMGGPLRRYTVDDETLLASSNSNRWQHNQGKDTDWAHVEQLMAAPVDLAAAARAYTPPVVLPSQVMRPRPSESDRTSGPQVMAIRHIQAHGEAEAGPAHGMALGRSTGAGRGQGQAGRLPAAGFGGPGRTIADGKGGSQAYGSVMGAAGSGAQQHQREEMVDLMYDPLLNCYYDQKTGNYYQLAAPS